MAEPVEVLLAAHAAGRRKVEQQARALLRILIDGLAGAGPDEARAYAADFAGAAADAVREAQDAVAALTFRFLDDAAEEMSGDDLTVPDPEIDGYRNVDPEVEWTRPVTAYLDALEAGQTDDDAVKRAWSRADAMLSDDVALAQSVATAAKTVEQKAAGVDIRGYRRIIRPEQSEQGSCGLCIAASDRVYTVGDLLPLHTRCHCGVLPIIGDNDPGRTLNEGDLTALYEAAGGTSAEKLSRVRFKVEQHSELGPRLVPAGTADPAVQWPDEAVTGEMPEWERNMLGLSEPSPEPEPEPEPEPSTIPAAPRAPRPELAKPLPLGGWERHTAGLVERGEATYETSEQHAEAVSRIESLTGSGVQDSPQGAWHRYTLGESRAINGMLQGVVTPKDPAATVRDILNLDRAFMEAGDVTTGVAVYRRGIRRTPEFDPADLYVEGTVVQEAGYLSMSTENPQQFAGYDGWVMNILVPPGERIIPGTRYEKEVILNRGTTHHVVKVDPDKRMVWTQVVEPAEPEPEPVVELPPVDTLTDDEIQDEITRLMEAGQFDDPRMDELAEALDVRDRIREQYAEEIARDEWEQQQAADRAAGIWRRTPGVNKAADERQLRDEYETWIHLQYLAAEAETNGVLLSMDGRREGVRAIDLFTRKRQNLKWASEELQEWFSRNPRMSYQEFRAGARNDDQARAARFRAGQRGYESEFG